MKSTFRNPRRLLMIIFCQFLQILTQASNSMTKILLVLSILIVVAFSGDCFGENCAHRPPTLSSEHHLLPDIVDALDHQIRRSYWYYLRDAEIIYQANVDTPQRYIIFFFYRNIVGTFLTIASWDKQTSISQINTMVRLGNGVSKNPSQKARAASIQPFTMTLKIGQDQGMVEMDQQGNLRVQGEFMNILSDVDQFFSEDQCFVDTDHYLRKNYWYYIRGSDLVNHQSLVTTKRVYYVLTYVNIVGTFLVIATCDGDVIKANTFVRLGLGGKPSSQLDPEY